MIAAISMNADLIVGISARHYILESKTTASAILVTRRDHYVNKVSHS